MERSRIHSTRGPRFTLAFLALLLAAGLLPAFPSAAAGPVDWTTAFETARTKTPGFAVESAEEFRKLTEHHQYLLSDGTAVHAFTLANGDQIRCIDVTTQRSLAASGQPLQFAPGKPPALAPGEKPTGPQPLSSRPGTDFGLDASPDPSGQTRACPAGSFPRLTPRLENFYRFRKLDDLFRKYPDRNLPAKAAPAAKAGKPTTAAKTGPAVAGAGIPPPGVLAGSVHEYAHAYRYVNNIGMSADFNLWSPFVEQHDEFSLSQLWVTRGNTSDDSLQTVETGWQNYLDLYGDSVSHLFIYSTTANYTSGSGCYNLSCTAFVQTDSSVVIGGSFSTYSSPGGTQYQLTLAVYRDPASSHWWLRYGTTWVGYYPNSRYNASGLASYSDEIDFGGEIVNVASGGPHTTTAMGSGRFASAGFGAAAYTKKIFYWDPSGPNYYAYNATGLTPSATNTAYYNIALGSSADTNWSQYFYFGGPGRTGSTCSFSLAPTSASYGSSGGSGTFSVSTSSGCTWSATSDSAWLTTGSSGSGSGSVSYSVASNGASSSRTGTITAGGQPFTVTQAGTTSSCTADAQSLCLASRFRVQATYRDYSGNTGSAKAVGLTANSGYFWIFDSTNIELVAKMVSFCSGSSGNWAIYASGLTDIQITFNVTDTKNGISRSYSNPLGNRFSTIADGPFPCP